MRARLYRGPHDGRVLEVPDHQRSIILKRARRYNVFDAIRSGQVFETTIIPTIDDEYRMVIFTDPPNRYGEAHTHVSRHPDGSVYFEWTQKRGTRIER